MFIGSVLRVTIFIFLCGVLWVMIFVFFVCGVLWVMNFDFYRIHRFISLDLRFQISSSRCHFGSIFHALQLFLRFFRIICFLKYVKYANFGSGYENHIKICFFCLQSYRRIFRKERLLVIMFSHHDTSKKGCRIKN